MTVGKWGDCVGKPSGAALRAAGYTGMWGYVGTPDRAKNMTAAVYRDWTGAGLAFGGIFEVDANDVAGGRAAGAANARAAMADAAALGIPNTVPLGATADEHLTAAQVSVAVQYQAGFHDTAKAAGWRGLVAAYGFGEFITAVAAAGVADVLWQAGSRSAVGGNVHFWQDNTGTDTVAGVAVDRDWQLLPIGGDMPLTQADLDAIWNYPISNPNLPTAAPVVAKLLLTFGDEAAWAALAAAQGADADTKAGVAQLLVAVHSQPTGGQVDVQALATALVPLLSASEGAALVAALKAQFDK